MEYIPDRNRRDKSYRAECRVRQQVMLPALLFSFFVEKCVIHA